MRRRKRENLSDRSASNSTWGEGPSRQLTVGKFSFGFRSFDAVATMCTTAIKEELMQGNGQEQKFHYVFFVLFLVLLL